MTKIGLQVAAFYLVPLVALPVCTLIFPPLGLIPLFVFIGLVWQACSEPGEPGLIED